MSVVITIVALTIALDQITKTLVTSFMEIGDSIPIINNVLHVTYHRNAGAAWGILQGRMLFFYVVTILVIGVIIIWLKRINIQEEKILTIAFSLFLGGAIGNFIDRLIYQEVIDFIDTFIFGYNFPIFNIADSALCIGVALMAIDAFLETKQNKLKTEQ